jgi:hypothetical protein
MRNHLPLAISLLALLIALTALLRPQPLPDQKAIELSAQIDLLATELKNLDELVQMHEERFELMRVKSSNEGGTR